MTPDQFCYWLQGFSEVNGNKMINEMQWRIIQDHLQLVFDKVTPVYKITDHMSINYQIPKARGGGGGC